MPATSPLGAADQRRKGMALVLFASILWSLAGVLMRMLHLDIWSIQLWRSLSTLLMFIPMLLIDQRGNLLAALRGITRIDLICAALGTIAMFSFVDAVAYTTVADVLIVYATLPFFAALFAWFLLREKVAPRTLGASVLALAGVVVMVYNSAGGGRWLGDAFSLSMTVTFALQIVLLRKYPGRSIVLINVISVIANALICAQFAPLALPAPRDLLIVAALGTLTIGLGMMLFTMGARLIPSAQASLIGLAEVVLGPLWVWLVFAENPGLAALFGGSLVLLAVLWQILGEIRHQNVALG